MAVETVVIRIVKDTKGVQSTIDELVKLGKIDQKTADSFVKNSKAMQGQVDKTNSSVGNMSGLMANLGPAIAGAFTIGALIAFEKQIFNVTSEFQKFKAVLKNTLGSEVAADLILSDLTEWASKMPFSLAEGTGAFLKLANNGIKPTMKEMTAFADVAANAGKGIDMFAEAVNDATRGEFERLKEFYIDGKTLADKYIFTFKNQTYETEKNAEAVKKLMVQLGQMEGVMGATAAISETLVGKASNLGDTWDRLLTTMGNNSEGIFSGGILGANTLLDALDKVLKTEQQIIKENALFGTNSFMANRLGGLTGDDRAKKAKELIPILEKEVELEKERIRFLNVYPEGLSEAKKAEIILHETKKNAIVLMKQEIVEFEALSKKTAKEKEDSVTQATADKKIASDKLAQIEAQKSAYQKLTERISFLTKEIQNQTLTGIIDNKMVKERINLLSKLEEVELKLAKAEEVRNPSNAKSIGTPKSIEHESEKDNRTVKGVTPQSVGDKQEGLTTEQRQANKDLAINATQEIADATFQIQQDNLNRETDLKLQALDKEREATMSNTRLTQNQKSKLAKDFDAQELKIRKDAFEKNRQNAISEALINGAIGITKAFTLIPPASFAAASLVALQTGLQVAVIQNQKFAKGVIDVKGGKRGEDSIQALIMPGESVMTTDETRKHKEMFTAIRNNRYDEFINRKYILPTINAKNNNSFSENVLKSLTANFDTYGIENGLKKIKDSEERGVALIVDAIHKSNRVRLTHK